MPLSLSLSVFVSVSVSSSLSLSLSLCFSLSSPLLSLTSSFSHTQGVPEPSSFPYLHKLCSDWLDVLIEKVWLQVVHTQLQCPQSLANESLRTIES